MVHEPSIFINDRRTGSPSRTLRWAGFLTRRRGEQPQLRRPARWAASYRTTHPRRYQAPVDVDATHIHMTKLSNDRHHRSSFGFCIDIGAPKSVIGRKELNRIFAEQYMRPPSL